MELDQIKNLWNKEEVVETPEISLEKQKEIHFPLEQIRKNIMGKLNGNIDRIQKIYGQT